MLWVFFFKKLDFSPQTLSNFLKHQNETLTLKWMHNIKMKPNPNLNSVLYTCVV